MSGDDGKDQGKEALEIDAEAPPDSAAPQELASAEDTARTHQVEALSTQIEQLQKEKKETYDRLLRTAADFDNFKKRSRKEAAEAEERGRTALLKELLPAVDNLERALAHESTTDPGAILDGVRLVLKQLGATLEKFDVRAIESTGKAFDPALHEAISQLETDEHPAGTVTSELQKGYTIGKKLLRPALVVVAKPVSRAAAKSAEGEEDGTGARGAEKGGADRTGPHDAIAGGEPEDTGDI
ncbi:MAG TPA: nucleotide exchange factor GrpE [Polyangia bacterium]|nr:nucleotide exchange factor GrpE [Polyangia bacterium]